MKKEGTGNPQNPDITLDATVRMRELRFEEAPETEVHFRGNTGHNSVWSSRRENLPDEVQEGVVYRNAGIRLRIASEIVNGVPSFQSNSDKERTGANIAYPGDETREQEPKSGKEKR